MKPSSCSAVHFALMRAVAAVSDTLAAAGKAPELRLRHAECADWASITLRGHRHELEIALLAPHPQACVIADQLQMGLAERQIPLNGQFIADVTVVTALSDDESEPVVLHVTALSILD
jgi:hypothetical protein